MNEVVIRVIIFYVFILFALRLMGKREFSQLSPMELVVLLLIPEIISQPISRGEPSVTTALIGLCTLFALEFLNSIVLQRFKKVEELIVPRPTILIYKGKLLDEYLNKERVTPSEIFAEMHRNGITELSEVKYAILEDDGKLSLIPEDASKKGQGSSEESLGKAGG